MSCKSVPKIPETRFQLVTKLEKGRAEKLCRRYGFKLCGGILLFIILSYCIFLHSSLKKIQKFTEKLDLSSKHPEILVKRHLDIGERQQRRNQHRRRRNDLIEELQRKIEELQRKIRDFQNFPLAHLEGNDGIQTTTSEDGCTHSQPCFLWKYPNYLYGNQFEYAMHGDKVVGVKITRAGYYHVYSQISVNGLINQDNIPAYPAFGYETIKLHVSGSEQTAIAMTRSFVTQDERGQWYSSVIGNDKKPLDSMNQMGIFRLNCGDIIMVRSTGQLNRRNIKFLQDPQQTFFGLALLRPRGLDDYSCF